MLRTLTACLFFFLFSATRGFCANPGHAITDFGIRLSRQLMPERTGNVVFSPYSMEMAFAMASGGANGQTLSEIRMTLGLPANESGHTQLQELQSTIDKAAESGGRDAILFQSTNRLFPANRFPLQPDFLRLTSECYGAEALPLDYMRSPASARKKINAWVEDKTRDRIRNLLPEGSVSKDTVLVLANAAYLKAQWAAPFEKNATTKRAFYANGTTRVDVPTMETTDYFGFAQNSNSTTVTLPYRGGEFAMVLLMPQEPSGLAALQKGLSADDVLRSSQCLKSRLHLFLPRFRIEGETMLLSSPLARLGMRTAWTPEADFSRMSDAKPLFFSDAFHQAFVEVTEKGTEAAAATAIVTLRGGGPIERPPIVVRIDRPFLFFILHQQSGASLFMGRVVNPAGR